MNLSLWNDFRQQIIKSNLFFYILEIYFQLGAANNVISEIPMHILGNYFLIKQGPPDVYS